MLRLPSSRPVPAQGPVQGRASLHSPFLLALAFVLGITLAGCGDGNEDAGPTDPITPPTPVPTTVQVTPTGDTLAVGDTASLSVQVLDQEGAPLADASVTWSSDATDVATVDSGGAVTAVGEGEARITARAGTAEGSAQIQVIRLMTEVDEDGGTVTTEDGGVTVEVPPGAVSEGVQVTIASEDVQSLPGGAVAGAAVRLGPAGITFAEPVTLTLAYDPALLPPGYDRSRLRIHRLTDGAWVPLTGTSDLEASRVSTALTSFSVYSVVAEAEADLAVEYTLAPDPVVVGSPLQHQGRLANLGPDSVFTAVVELRVDGSVAPPASLPSACVHEEDREDADLVVRCTFEDLGPGDAHDFTLTTATLEGSTSVEGTLEVVLRDGPDDPNAENDQATAAVTVEEPSADADLSVTLSTPASPVEFASTVVATVAVANAGPDPVTDMVVGVRWPEGRLQASAEVDAACASVGPSAGVEGVDCGIDALAAGADRTLELPLRALGEVGEVNLVASIASWSGARDPDLSNNESQATITVVAPDILVVEGQDAVASLAGITTLPSTLRLVGGGITSLAPLASLEVVGGDLRIEDTNITSLDGLESLVTVDGSIALLRNPLLERIDALGGLSGTLPGFFFLLSSPLVSSLDGLQNLTALDGSLTIQQAPGLTDISAVSGLVRTGGLNFLALGIEDLSALANLEQITGSFNLFWNTMPVDHIELPALEVVGGNFGVSIFPGAPSPEAGPTLRMPSLREAGTLWLTTALAVVPSVTTAEFPALETVNGTIRAGRSRDLGTLDLGALTSVPASGEASVLGLVDLPALDNLTLGPVALTTLVIGCEVGTSGCLAANAALTDLSGISSGLSVSNVVMIRGNPGFSDEDAQALVDRIQAGSASVLISGNGPPEEG